MKPGKSPQGLWATSDHPIVRALREFIATETSGGLVLLVAALAALAWANSPWSDGYQRLWDRTLFTGPLGVSLDLRHWVNDGLMTIFFFVVGLEIKRELVAGELSSPRKAMLPALAALGGMIVPAAAYLAVNAGTAEVRGWGIPMATDIAFALGALALFGRSLPSSLRVFLLSLAIVDDIGAIMVIAVFYTGGVDVAPLAIAVALLGVVAALPRAGLAQPPLYVLVGVGVWFAVHAAGIHATLAGVAVGLLVPARAERDSDASLAERIERALHPWSGYVIVPLFALANAGVALSSDSVSASLGSRLGAGIVAGLVAGKLAGISGTVWLVGRTGLSPLPEGARRRDLNGVAALAGIGFTVSLFIAGLAFSNQQQADQAKIAVLTGSLLASALGAAILRPWRRR